MGVKELTDVLFIHIYPKFWVNWLTLDENVYLGMVFLLENQILFVLV